MNEFIEIITTWSLNKILFTFLFAFVVLYIVLDLTTSYLKWLISRIWERKWLELTIKNSILLTMLINIR